MKCFKYLCLVLSAFIFSSADKPAYAQSAPQDPRGKYEVTICSQNLESFGSQRDSLSADESMTAATYKEKLNGLVQRFKVADCDLIAVQEVLGKTEETALAALESLAAALSKESRRPFEARISPHSDGRIRNGYLVALDRASIINLVSFARLELPKLDESEKVILFDRAPLEIQVEVKGKDDAKTKIITLLNFHFKSRSGAKEDPTALQFETIRMQMAEAVRRLADIRYGNSIDDDEQIVALLGDRNTDSVMAAAKILDGSLALMDFKVDGPCRLSKIGLPVCKTENRRPQKFFSPLTADKHSSGIAGTYFYKDQASWIDDILLNPAGLKFARVSVLEEGDDYDTGTISKPKIASDHSLVFVRLNW